jgi:hypothetical protein
MLPKLIDGELCSELGIPLQEGVRCPHGVVDGAKPLAATGPRCGVCREEWYPREVAASGMSMEAHCPTCGEHLHRTYVMRPALALPSHARQRQQWVPHTWSHNEPGCQRSAFPVRGFEEYFNFYGWGRWEAHAALLRANVRCMPAVRKHWAPAAA